MYSLLELVAFSLLMIGNLMAQEGVEATRPNFDCRGTETRVLWASEVKLPAQSDLRRGEHCFLWHCDTASPLSCGYFIHRQSDWVPENEFRIDAYYHPAYILDNINGGRGHRESVVFRAAGVGKWMLQSDVNNNDDYLFAIQQEPDSAQAVNRLFFIPANQPLLGVGPAFQEKLQGNAAVGGYIASWASTNDTSGRAAFAWQRTTGEQTWLRLAEDGARDLEFSRERDGGRDTYWRIFNDKSGTLASYDGDGHPVPTNISSGLKVGTAGSVIVNSSDLVQGVYNAKGSLQVNTHIVMGRVRLDLGGGWKHITLQGASAFFSRTSYECQLTNATEVSGAPSIHYEDGAHFAIGSASATEISYLCVGN